MSRSTNLVIISGPSGAGEDSVIQGLLDRSVPIERVITTVTRLPREGESEGNPYHFVSEEEFDQLIHTHQLAEWASVYGDKRGVTKRELERVKNTQGKIGLWKIDWHGVVTAKKLFPDILAIMISVPSVATLVKRLEKRGQDETQKIFSRINFTKDWLEHKALYDYEVVNKEGKLEQTIVQVIQILDQEGYATT